MARPKKTPHINTCNNILCNKKFETRPSESRPYCSKTCAQQFKKTNKDWIEKRKKTCLKKYGNENAFKSEQVQKTYKDNLLKKYGKSNPFLIKEFRDKAKKTNIERYGHEVAMSNKEIAKKTSKSLKGRILKRDKFADIKYEKLIEHEQLSGMKPLFDKQELEEKKINVLFKNKFKFKCNKCSSITEVMLGGGYLPHCKCSNYNGISKTENDIIEFLKKYIDIQPKNLNRRDIIDNKKEIDIYLPEHNLAIELNGIYWHSESFGKDKHYHLDKTNECESKNIQLIHILDTEWNSKKEIIQSIILNKLNINTTKIFARKCKIKEIKDTSIIKEFLNNNHIQGYTHSKINLGLYYNNELVSLMTFGKNRFKKQSNEWELIRFCNKLNHSITGGASKLFKYFENNYNIENQPLISFSDRRFFDGNFYEKLGFDFDQFTPPSYIYWKQGVTLNRMSCQKHKLNKLLEIFNPDISEYENMKLNGYDRVWDCGNRKFVKNYL